MSLPLRLSPTAEAEVQQAASWYAQVSRTIAVRFLEQLEAALESIRENPKRFPVVHRDIRRAQLGSYPYGVFFRLKPKWIRVLGVMHLARNPKRWQGRR
jgi:toxin ParE1/3/4